LHLHKDNTNSHNHQNLNYTPVDEFDNDNSYYLFIPKISVKPNKLEDLNPQILEARESRLKQKEKFLQINFSDKRESYRNPNLFNHPYQFEIETKLNIVNKKLNNLNDSFKKIVIKKTTSSYLNINNYKAIDEFPNEKFTRTDYTKIYKINEVNETSFYNQNYFHNYVFNNNFNNTEEEDIPLIDNEKQLINILQFTEYHYEDLDLTGLQKLNFINTKEGLLVN